MTSTRPINIALFTLFCITMLQPFALHAQTVRIGVNERIASWPLIIAEARGYFEKQDVSVEFIPLSSVQEHFNLLDDEAIDLMTITSDQLLLAEQFGYELTGAFLLGESHGADAIFVSDDINSVRQLRGKRVGFERSGAGELLLRHALQRKGLSLGDVLAVSLPDESSNGTIDAIVVQAPWNQNQLPEGFNNAVYSSKNTQGLIMDTLAGEETWIDEHKEELKRIIRAWDKAVAWQNRNPLKAARIIEKTTQIDAEIIQEWFAKVSYLGTQENLQSLRGSYQKSFMAMSEVMQTVLGSDRALPSANSYFSPAAMRQVAIGR